MSTNDMAARAEAYRRVLSEIKALQDEADAIRAELVAEMDARKVDAVTAGAFTVRYSAYQSTRVDTAKLKADGLYDQYSSKQTALRFSVQ